MGNPIEATEKTARPITAIEVAPKHWQRYQEIAAELRQIAVDSIDPVWTFVQIQPLTVEVGGAVLVRPGGAK